jgi:outer membrane protein assembly factor BamB
MILAGVLQTPPASFCSDYWLPPFANVAWTGEAVVVAYDAKDGAQVEAHSATDGGACWSKRIPSAILARDACAVQGLVFVATQNQGIHVLHSDTGAVKTCLRPHSPVSGSPLLACAGNRVLVAYEYDNWLIAYGTQSIRPVWKHLFSIFPFHDLKIYQIAARRNKLTVLLFNPSGEGRWAEIALQSGNGRFISKRPADAPPYVLPDYLPKAVQRWYRNTVGIRSTLVGPTTYIRRGKLWFVSVPAELNCSGTIYAVRDDGRVVWATSARGLSSVVLADNRLVAATVPSDGNGGIDTAPGNGKLFALDAKSGRQLWLVGLNGSGVSGTK